MKFSSDSELYYKRKKNRKDTFNAHFNSIQQLKPLEPKEEEHLFNILLNYRKQRENGSVPREEFISELQYITARNKVVENHLKFAIFIAREYKSKLKIDNYFNEDLRSEAEYGLIIAAERFDINKGIKFISYAVWWINSKILKYLEENLNNVRVSSSTQREMRKLRKEQERFSQIYETNISVEQAIKLSGKKFSNFERERIRKGGLVYSSVSLDYFTSDLEGRIFIDSSLNSLEMDYKKEKIEAVESALSILNEKEREIIYDYYFPSVEDEKTKTLEEIAKKLNITKEGVRQKRNKIIKKIKREAIKILHE